MSDTPRTDAACTWADKLKKDVPNKVWREMEKLERELAKWEKPFDQEQFDAVKLQASHGDSLAARGIYITALEHALKHKERELAEQDRLNKLANDTINKWLRETQDELAAAQVELAELRFECYLLKREQDVGLEAQKKLTAAQKDAERYRWLRSQDWIDSALWDYVVEDYSQLHTSEDWLDAAIDAAIES